MQSIYTYITETNNVSKEYNVAAILSLLFMAPISLAPALTQMYYYISTFRNMCAVPNMAVFCSSLTSCFRITVLTYFQNYFEITTTTTTTTTTTAAMELSLDGSSPYTCTDKTRKVYITEAI
jgi:hypothetical protein